MQHGRRYGTATVSFDHHRTCRFRYVSVTDQGNGWLVTSTRRLLAWIWTGLIAATVVFLAVLSAPDTEGQDIVLGFLFLVSILAITALGSVVTARRPGNRIAWLLHLISASLLFTLWSATLIGDGPPESQGFPEYLAAMVQTSAAVTAMYSIVLLLYVFPTGRFLTPRWRWAGWIGAVLIPASWFISLFTVDVGGVWAEEPWSIPNPIGFLPVEALASLEGAAAPILLITLLGGVASITVRFRRSDQVVRTQIKWVLFASIVTLLSSLFAFSGLGLVSDILTLVVLNAIPVAVATAVLKYKLFEIDRIISRTVSYSLVVILLGLVFAAGAVWIPTSLGLEDTPILVVASTLAAAALFNPLRKRIQKIVDKRFNRIRYQADKVAEEFASRLQASLTPHQLVDIWVQTVDTHFQPSTSGAWLKSD